MVALPRDLFKWMNKFVVAAAVAVTIDTHVYIHTFSHVQSYKRIKSIRKRQCVKQNKINSHDSCRENLFKSRTLFIVHYLFHWRKKKLRLIIMTILFQVSASNIAQSVSKSQRNEFFCWWFFSQLGLLLWDSHRFWTVLFKRMEYNGLNWK